MSPAQPAGKIIKAKYASACPLCNNKINVGDDILFKSGEKPTHPEGKCPPKKTEQAKGGIFFELRLKDDLIKIITQAMVEKTGTPPQPQQAPAVMAYVKAIMEERKKK